MRFLVAFRAATRGPLLQVAKTALAIALSWFAAVFLLGVPTPIFAAIAAILVVLPSVNQSFERGIERSIGVVLGVVIAAALGAVFGNTSWVVLVAIGVALIAAWLLKVTPGTTNQMAISAMLVLALGGTSDHYALDRILETLIGCAIGIIINALIVPPVRIEPARQKLELLGSELSAHLDRLATALTTPQTSAELQGLMIEARLLRPMEAAAKAAIADGRDSLAMNPRRSRHREELATMQTLLDDVLAPIVRRVVGMTRAVLDHHNESVPHELSALAIADQLHRASHDVRLVVYIAEVDPDPITSAIPALTAPLELRPPRSENWILIGSLTEDVRRVREILLGENP
ncbi:FUSC family protein [Gulosibacter macacae]|uniref:FUSC family protein n=1 Tax=Gulosibacter macacae TaxID=2488791 RepID=A0A3P3VWK0_9MICO|nr:FUSC family protein [Gulosibacter macacae]RRJ87070.1 FUSC family protein [Gulosibacter macacae]